MRARPGSTKSDMVGKIATMVQTMVRDVHTSPDGLLAFVIETLEDGDVLLGFEQSQWHTHAHFLVPVWGETEPEAVKAYADALLNGTSVIGVRRKNGFVVSAWIVEDLAFEADTVDADETLELRHWDGRLWKGGTTAKE